MHQMQSTVKLPYQTMKRSKNSESDTADIKCSKRPREEQTIPQYGSKEYWEARYKSHLTDVDLTSKKNVDTGNNDRDAPDGQNDDAEYVLDGVKLSKDAINPGHAWYFTYQELRPLIIPLIFGSEENSDDDVGSDCDDGDSWQEVEEGDEDAEIDVDIDVDNAEARADIIDEEEKDDDDHYGEKKGGAGNSEEIDEQDEDTEDMPKLKEIIQPDKPRKVLEVGCGDMPLGSELAADLATMQQDTGISANLLVNKITCIDYSEIVVKSLIEKQAKKHNSSPLTVQVNFDSLDARSLPYSPNTYDLVLEKGTLDAMLSDQEEGKQNCISIVKEMARVTGIGGSILIVSHLNANESKGLKWLEDVVSSGLAKEFDERRDAIKKEARYYTWTVEVHGGEGQIVKDEDDEEEYISYGPAVYILRKKGVAIENADKLFKRKKNGSEKDNKDGCDDAGEMTMPPAKVEFLTYDE